MDARRTARVAEAIRQELAEIIGYEMGDPRVAAVMVTEVILSRDLKTARVKVAAGEDEERQRAALEALEGARHWIRRELAGRLRIWRIPQVHFQADAGGQGQAGGPEVPGRGQAASG
ncbi:MAG: 30S ribosome-binding factor RbfA [Bryobacteraceae bacterium]